MYVKSSVCLVFILSFSVPFFGWPFVILFSFLFFIPISNLLLAGYTDPGIIPKQKAKKRIYSDEEEAYQDVPEPKKYTVKDLHSFQSKFCSEWDA